MRDISYYDRDQEGARMAVSAHFEPGPSLVNVPAARQPPPLAPFEARTAPPRRPRWPSRLRPPWPSFPMAYTWPPLRHSSTAGTLPPRGRVRGAEAPRTSPEYAEHRRRTVAAILLVYALAQANLGLAWDIRWHGAVGREDF